MTTTTLKYEGDIDDAVLLNMATFYGWKAEIPDPNNPETTIPNPQSYQVFACLQVLGMNFISLTVDRCCEPDRENTLPKDYPSLIESTRENILSTTTVTINGQEVYPY